MPLRRVRLVWVRVERMLLRGGISNQARLHRRPEHGVVGWRLAATWHQIRYLEGLTGLLTGSLAVSDENDIVAWHDGSQSCHAFL